MKFRPRLLVVTCTLLVGGALLAGADNIASIDADLAPQMVAEAERVNDFQTPLYRV